MAPDLLVIFDRVRTLLDSSAPDPGGSDVEEMEHTLTDGYAAALALEGECWRLGRRMQELSRAGDEPSELQGVAGRLHEAEDELGRLRELLATLRRRTDAARAASVSS